MGGHTPADKPVPKRSSRSLAVCLAIKITHMFWDVQRLRIGDAADDGVIGDIETDVE